MAHRHSRRIRGAAALALVLVLPVHEAAATTCTNGAAATIDSADCTVQTGTIPTTVTFSAGATGQLILNGAVPNGDVTTGDSGLGTVVVQGTVSMVADFGASFGGDLGAVNILNGATLNANHNIVARTITVGQGTSGVLNLLAGSDGISAKNLVLNAGATLDQILNGGGISVQTATTLDTGATLTIRASINGIIDGVADGRGTLILDHDRSSNAVLGGTHSLAEIKVNDGVTFNLANNATATTITVGQGSSGVLNQSAGTLTATTLTVNAGGTLTQTGSGIINAATTLGSGASLTLKNQGTGTIDGAAAGQGTLTFSGNYDTDAAIGGTNRLAAINVNNGVTLTLDQNARASSVTVGAGTSGVLNQSAGTLTATTLTVNAGGTLTQTGSGIINAATTLGSGASLTLKNQGTGTIDGAAAGQGTLTFSGNYDTDAALGGTNRLAAINVNNGVTLTLDQNARASSVTVGAGTSGVINQSAGTLTATTVTVNNGGAYSQSAGTLSATTLAISAGGSLTQTGTGVINANTTLGNGVSLTLKNQGSGSIDGAANGLGTLSFSGSYNSDSALGGTHKLAAINVNDGASLNLGHNAVATSVTVGAGASGVINQSAGTLTATTVTVNNGGAYSQSAGILSATTLAISAGGTLTQTGTGLINANTILGSGVSLTLKNQGSGSIDGAAAGQGTLTFSGNYDTDAALGGTNRLAAINVNNGVTLTLDQNARADSVTVGQGTSGVINQSAGTLTATTLAINAGGTFTQSGGAINANTTLGSGATLTLKNQGSGSIDGAAAGQGTLTFAGDYTTDAALGGTQRLAAINVNSAITLGLSRNASATSFNVSGTVNHSAGTLTATSLAINSGGIFNQSGTAGITAATTIFDGGTLNVGSSFSHTGALTLGSGNGGQLNLNGHTVTVSSGFSMVAGAILKTTINADSANAAGHIVASGPLAIAAKTTININVLPATLSVGQSYVIVSGAAGGAVNLPTSIISSNANYEFTTSSDGSSLTLTTKAAASYLQAAQSPNTQAVAGALQSARTSGTADMATVLSQLNSLSSNSAKDAAMASMAPIMDNALPLANRVAQDQVFGTIGTRLESLRNRSSDGPSGFSSGNPMDGLGFWLQAFGSDGTQNAREGASGFKTQTRGLAFSADTVLPNTRWTLGASIAYAGSNISFKDARSGNSSDISSYQASLYGSYDGNGFYLDAIASLGRNAYASSRLISIGENTRRASGDFNGLQYSTKATVGFPLQHGSMVVTPLASIEYTHMGLDAYTETGAGALNLNVDAQHYDSLQLGLGASVRFDTWLGNGKLAPTLRAMWLFDTHSDPQTLLSSFTGGGGSSFTTSAPDAARHSLKLGAGMRYTVGRYTTWAFNYDVQLKDGFLGHAAMLTYHHQF
jgi:fibronectin-binding autotransporter adhesin